MMLEVMADFVRVTLAAAEVVAVQAAVVVVMEEVAVVAVEVTKRFLVREWVFKEY